MPDDAPHFDDRGRLIAPKYDDVYFSAEDGLAETRHVFLAGNRLAERFASLASGERFTIGETGFGTGLNFLAAWQLFEQHAPADARLEFVSVEGFPLDVDTIGRALSPWPELHAYREALVQQWGPLWPGFHRFRFAGGRVRLTLLVGEVAEVLSGTKASVDAWFLDGFAPSRNPDMWSEAVFAQVARLSGNEATLATYTAAGFVRRRLEAAGFAIEKRPGFGTKRDMTVGRYAADASSDKWGGHSCLPSAAGRSVVVIGASLAGAFAARALAERGFLASVIERQALVGGELPTLSPRVAVLQPKISDIDDANGRWLREGYAHAIRLFDSGHAFAERAGWHACGTFQAAHDARAERQQQKFVQQFGQSGLCRWIEPSQTEAYTGLDLPVGGVFVDRAGTLRPAGLCAALLDHPNITQHEATSAISLQRDGQAWTIQLASGSLISTDTVILANALEAKRFEQTHHLDLKPVRGQVTLLQSTEHAGRLAQLRCPVFYGGYILPAVDGLQTLGASFIPGVADTHWRDDEHRDVCDKLARLLPEEADRLRSMDNSAGWVGLRTTTPTHRCYAEEIQPGLYVSLGHGSHGIASAARAAEHLADLIIHRRQGVVRTR